MAFDGILCNKEEILSINPCSNVFVFGDFNIHHKDSLTYDGETNRIGELCHNFIQTINFPTRIPDCDSHSPLTVTLTVLLFLNYLFLLALVFFFFNDFLFIDHVVVSVSIESSSNSKIEGLFRRIVYDYYFADWDCLRDNLEHVPWEDIFKLSASAAASEI